MEEFEPGCMCRRMFERGGDVDYIMSNVYGAAYIPIKIRGPVPEFKVLVNALPEEGEIIQPDKKSHCTLQETTA